MRGRWSRWRLPRRASMVRWSVVAALGMAAMVAALGATSPTPDPRSVAAGGAPPGSPGVTDDARRQDARLGAAGTGPVSGVGDADARCGVTGSGTSSAGPTRGVERSDPACVGSRSPVGTAGPAATVRGGDGMSSDDGSRAGSATSGSAGRSPAGTVGVPVRLADPAAARVVRPGDRVTLVVLGADTGTPTTPVSDVLVLPMPAGADDPTSALVYLALTEKQASRVAALEPDARLGIRVLLD